MKHDPLKPKAPATDPPALSFTPVHVRARWDGWTPDKQIAFVEALSETACVEEACRIVGMSAVSAYALRRRPPAQNFREAWDAALDMGVHRLEQAVLGRALNGVPRPVFYKGEQVGEWRDYDERLAMFLLRCRRPRRYGAALDPAVAVDTDPLSLDNWRPEPDDPAVILDWQCDQIANLSNEVWTDEPPAEPDCSRPGDETPRA